MCSEICVLPCNYKIMHSGSRVIVGTCTYLIVVFLVATCGQTTSFQYWTCLAALSALLLIVLLVPDADRVTLEAFSEGTTVASAIPLQFYNVLAPSLDRLTAVVRGDDSGGETHTTDLEPASYTGPDDALTLHGSDGSVDKDKFNAMKLDYKRIVLLLCRMKHIAPVAHDSLVRAMGAC